MIGFAGDIFMGRYDDSKYVADLKAEERQQSQPKKTSASEMKRGLEEIDKDLLDCTTIADVDKCAKVWRCGARLPPGPFHRQTSRAQPAVRA